MDIKLNQSGQDMSLPVVIQFEIQIVKKKVTFNITFLSLLSLIVNVIFCHKDGGGDVCKFDILVVVS